MRSGGLRTGQRYCAVFGLNVWGERQKPAIQGYRLRLTQRILAARILASMAQACKELIGAADTGSANKKLMVSFRGAASRVRVFPHHKPLSHTAAVQGAKGEAMGVVPWLNRQASSPTRKH